METFNVFCCGEKMQRRYNEFTSKDDAHFFFCASCGNEIPAGVAQRAVCHLNPSWARTKITDPTWRPLNVAATAIAGVI